MAPERYQRKLTAILSADVAGYSRLMGDDEPATVETLNIYKEIMTALVQQHRGRVVDFTGDNLLAEFASVVDAVQCGVAVQKELQARNFELPDNRKMEFRIGINLGDVIQEGDRIYGDGVNIAARLEALADPGGICVSKTAFDHIESKLPLGYEFLGDQTVKNIAKPVGAYRVLMEPRITVAGTSEEKKGPVKLQRSVLRGAIACLLVVIGVVIWNFYFRPPVEPASVEKMALPLPDKPSLAVLPFVNLSGDKEQEHIVDGLTENIIDAISKIPEMFVVARNSTFTYKGKQVKVRQVAEDLGVQYVLEGSVQKSKGRLRVTAQLIDALKGHHIWSEKYDREMRDLFSVQDDITLNIAVAMQVELTDGEQAQVRHSTDNLEAWGLAVKAHDLFVKFSRENNAKAQELFKKAVELDPNYVFAWTYLGWTYWIAGRTYVAYYDRELSYKKVEEAVQMALSINKDSSDTNALLSALLLAQGRYDEAVEAGKRAIVLDPNSADNHAIVSITMDSVGEFKEAIALIKRAMRLDPFYPPWYELRLGISNISLGQYAEAVTAFKETIRLNAQKGHTPAYSVFLHLAAAYSMMGKREEAREVVDKVIEKNPKMTTEFFRKWFTYKNPAHTERILDALRNVGLAEKEALPLPDKPSIAVLPFVNMGDDPKQEYFSDGITEQIITGLSRVPKLFVIARTSTFKYKGREVDVRSVGRELGVRYVLEGSVQKSGNRLRITAQLIDAVEGHHLWSERYDRGLKEIFALQDDITLKIMTAMQVKLTMGEQRRALKKGTDNFEAYVKYIQAYEALFKFTKQDNILCRRLTEEALALDPGFGLAYSVLGWTYSMEARYGWSKSFEQSLSKAIELAKKALALDDSLDCAHGLLAYCYGQKGDNEKAVTESSRAIELAPNSERANQYLGRALIAAGRPDEAILKYERAIRLSPFPSSTTLLGLGEAYFFLRRYGEAISMCKKAVDVSPGYLTPRIFLTAAYSASGREEESRAEAKEVLRLNPKFSVDWVKTWKFKKKADIDLIVNGLLKAGLM